MTDDVRRTIKRENRPILPRLAFRPFFLPCQNPVDLLRDELLTGLQAGPSRQDQDDGTIPRHYTQQHTPCPGITLH